MSYAENSHLSAPQVLKTRFDQARTGFNEFLRHEKEVLPGQVAQLRQEIEAEIHQLETSTRDYWNNPKVRRKVEKLEAELASLEKQGQEGFNRLVHPKASIHALSVRNPSRYYADWCFMYHCQPQKTPEHTLPPNDLTSHSLQHYNRIAKIYGDSAAARAAETHGSMATGSASHRW
ncbi:hypothetical protein JCM5350_004027 [Sporobolomyces pararoseus]